MRSYLGGKVGYTDNMRARGMCIGVGLACLFVLPGCLYMMAARLAVNAVTSVARAASDQPTQSGQEIPQDSNILMNNYIHCLRERNQNPMIDCTQHRLALQHGLPPGS